MSYAELKEYKPLTEEELEEFWPIVTAIATKFFWKCARGNGGVSDVLTSIEDLESDLYPHLLEAVRKYDPSIKIEGGTHKGAYIYSMLSRRVNDAFRNRQWVTKDHYQKLISEGITPRTMKYAHSLFQNNSEEFDNVWDSISETFDEKPSIEKDEFISYLFKNLPVNNAKRTYQQLYLYYVEGQTISTICKELNIGYDNFFLIIRLVKPTIIERANSYMGFAICEQETK